MLGVGLHLFTLFLKLVSIFIRLVNPLDFPIDECYNYITKCNKCYKKEVLP